MTDEPAASSEIIEDKPTGVVAVDRLVALARRVGPSWSPRGPVKIRHILLVIVFCAAVAFLAVLNVVGALVHSKKEIKVPDLKGKGLEQALDALGAAGLSMAKDSVEFNESVAPGSVLRQVPAAGMKTREGRVVRVTLSQGGQMIYVPDLVNRPLQDARNQLRARGLALGALSEVYSDAVEAGWVLEQSPAANASLGRGQMVDLKVSKGPAPEGVVAMPDFVGQPYDKVQEWLKSKDLKANILEEVRSDSAGLVLRQSPAANTAVKPTSSLQFVISRAGVSMGTSIVFRYQVPAGVEESQVRMVLKDGRGEREVYRALHSSGQTVEVPAVTQGPARMLIFINGEKREERAVE